MSTTLGHEIAASPMRAQIQAVAYVSSKPSVVQKELFPKACGVDDDFEKEETEQA